mgnify:FL=1
MLKIVSARDYDDMSRKAANIISAQVILKDGQPFVKVGGPAVALVRGEIEL